VGSKQHWILLHYEISTQVAFTLTITKKALAIFSLQMTLDILYPMQ